MDNSIPQNNPGRPFNPDTPPTDNTQKNSNTPTDPMGQSPSTPPMNSPNSNSMPNTEPMPMTAPPLGGNTPPPPNPGNTPPPMASKRKPNTILKFIIIFFILGILLLGGTATTAVLAAYGKITLPWPKVQETISFFVQDLSFMPKTPKYVLEKSALVHKELSSAYVKASFATKSAELSNMLGVGNLELAIEGPVDFADQENLKSKMNIKLTKELDLDLEFLDNIGYFRINKIPAAFYPWLQLTSSNIDNNPFLNTWVFYDFTTLETDAAAALEKRDKDLGRDENKASSALEDELIKFINEEILTKVVMTTEKLGESNQYKLTMNLTAEDLEKIQSEIARLYEQEASTDYQAISKNGFSAVRDLSIELWINKESYELNKAQILFSVYESAYQDSLQVLGTRTIVDTDKSNYTDFAMTIELSRLGEDFSNEIVIPAGAISFETYMLNISQFYYDAQFNNNNTDPSIINGESLEEDDFEGFGTTDPNATRGLPTN